MKKYSIDCKTCIYPICIFLFLVSCGLLDGDDNLTAGDELEIDHFTFLHTVYLPDEPVILRAVPVRDYDLITLRDEFPQYELHSSTGAIHTLPLIPWELLTDEQMAKVINGNDGQTIFRIKDPDMDSAVNSEGELIRSDEAMEEFISVVNEDDNVTVGWRNNFSPDIGITFLKADPESINKLRNHRTVEFMMLNPLGVPQDEALSPIENPLTLKELYSVIEISEINIQPGEELTIDFDLFGGVTASTKIVDPVNCYQASDDDLHFEERLKIIKELRKESDSITRWDSPAWFMSAIELAEEIDEADGQVFIGFREPDQLAGVDGSGNVLVSDETVLCGKVNVQEMGVDILNEFRLTPAITVEIPPDPDLIIKLRNFALIDYVEPASTGEYHRVHVHP